MTILGKKQMSEEDIKLNYITPVILNGWKGHITMETKITDGRINISGNIVARSKPKFADYMLYLNDGKPIAVVEAKDNNHSVSHGLQQAMTYAQMMDIPFAYSSNGDAFYEHDFFTGQERQIALEQFPTQDELVARYYAELNGGKGVSDLEKKIVSQPYYSSQSTYPPRYYQRNAVNRTVEAIARGQQRLLLVMATGTGKTYTAFQIVYRLLRSDLKKRILYLADRNILVDQSILQDFAPLEKTIYKVDFSDKECLSKIASHEVNFALYHQMVGQNDEEHFKQIPAEYFNLIIVDECHRGSAKEDSNWRKVLEYFSSATQIGMTATPKESEKVYFVRKMDSFSFRMFDEFYNCASEILEQQQLMKNLQKNSLFLTQQMLMQSETNYILQILAMCAQNPVDVPTLLKTIEGSLPTDASDEQKTAFENLMKRMTASNQNIDPNTFWNTYNQSKANLHSVINQNALTHYIPVQIRITLENALKKYNAIQVIGCEGYRKLKKIANRKF